MKSAATHHVAYQTKARTRNQAQERTIIPVGMVNWSGLDQEFLGEQFHFVQHPFAFHMRVAHLMRVPLANCDFGGDTRCTCLERSALYTGESLRETRRDVSQVQIGGVLRMPLH